MSSTRRPRWPGAQDFYETPPWAASAIVRDYTGAAPALVLDPGCGTGNLTAACLEQWPSSVVRGIERDASLAKQYDSRFSSTFRVDHLHADYQQRGRLGYDLAICNPPFSLAQEFVSKMRADQPDAAVACLLRLAFLESKKRLAWWQTVGTPSLRILVPRPSFNARGTSDSSAYAWFCWNWPGSPLAWLRRGLPL